MKRGMKSIILLAALAVLLGGYGIVGKMNRQAQVSEEAGSFALFEGSADEISALSWTNDGMQYRFVRGEDGWEREGDAAFPLNRQAVEDMAARLASMQASRRLTGVENIADYGLGDDSFAVTAEWADGKITRCISGDETPFADGWYLCIDGEDGVVYTAASSLEAMFAETDIDLAELEEIGSVESAASLQVGDELNLACREEGGFDPDQRWFSADGEPVDDAAVDELISCIQALEWQELCAVNATEEQLCTYGLDDAGATLLSLRGDDDAGLDICLGAADDAGDYYARLPGSRMVYTLDGDSVQQILASDMDALWSNAIFTPEYASIQSFSCTTDTAAQTFLHAEESDADDDSADTDPAEAIWEQIRALRATARSEARPAGEALLTISAVNMDGMEQACSFYACDVDSYLAVVDGERGLLVPADDVDRLIRMLR